MARWVTHRNDEIAADIDRILESVGAVLSKTGPLDRIVGFRGANFLLEYKTGRSKLRASQERFLRGWKGQAAVVRTQGEALTVIGLPILARQVDMGWRPKSQTGRTR